ncbi:MAG: type II toxin-antitoxin system VapC family toxin [Roseiflexaceae bacterium]
MPLVVDTSIILAVVLNEPTKAELIRLTTGAELIAPLSLHWEIGNALSAMLKRNRITKAEALQALFEYQKIPIRFLDVSLDEAIDVVAQHLIYAYAAYFIVCARQQSSALLTLDGGLQTAARAAHISLVEVTP